MALNYRSKLFGGGPGGGTGASLTTQVLFNNAGVVTGSNDLTFNDTTDTLTTTGTISARNLTATALATPGAITVTPVLSKIGSITTVAGSALVDGDYFTIKYASGLTVPIEFDLTPGDGTTGGRVPYVYAAGDSADAIRDGLITLLNAAAGTALTASSGGAATVALVLDTPGAAGDTNTENVANAGFAVTGFSNPTAATTYTYRLVARLADGTTTEAGATSTTAAGHGTLSTANYNALSWSAVTGAVSYDVYRTVGGATQGKIASATTALVLSDTGLAGDGSTAPTVNTTGVMTGRGVLATGSTIAKGTGGATATFGGVLYASGAAVATGGTAEETLATYTLPANTLNTTGRVLRITAWGTTAANTNNKTLKIVFGGTTVSSTLTATSALSMFHVATIIRTGSNTQVGYSMAGHNANAVAPTGAGVWTGLGYTTSSTETDTSTIEITIKATTPTAAADFTLRGFIVEVLN